MKKILLFASVCIFAEAQFVVPPLQTPFWELSSEYGGLAPPIRKETPHNLQLAFDLLYWQPKTDYTELGTPIGPFSQNHTGQHTSYVGFSGTFGFKAGVGYHIARREWDLGAQYTRVSFTGGQTLSVNDTAAFSDSIALQSVHSNFGLLEGNSEITGGSMHTSHAISYQTLNLDLSRLFPLGCWSIRPLFGVKVAWINHGVKAVQKRRVTEGGATTTFGDQHTVLAEKSVGVGPRACCGTNWYLAGGWSVYGNTAVALLFNRYRGTMNVSSTESAAEFADNQESKRYAVPNLELGLGVAYEKRFSQAKKNLQISLGYETQYYINQSYLMQNREVQDGNTPQGAWFARNLAVYGVTGSASLEF